MVDEQSQEVDPELTERTSEVAGGAPVNRDNRLETGVIEGQVSRDDEEPAGAVRDSAETTDAPRRLEPGRSGNNRLGDFLFGALGGFVAAAVALAAAYYFLERKVDGAGVDAGRIVAMGAQFQRDDATVESIGRRVAALEENGSPAANREIDKRLEALMTANADDGSKIASVGQAVQTLSAGVKDLRADVDAARGEIPALSARMEKLESNPPQASAVDLSAIISRIGKIEAQLAAPKSESRVAPDEPEARDNPAAVAIVAASLRDKFVRGEPFSTELGGLMRLGVEPATLAPLKAVVDGAPTDAGLAAAFDTVRSKVLAAVAPEQAGGGIADRFVAHLRGLIQIRNLNETAGEDPQALAVRIEADCKSGDVSGALTAFAKLPGAAREAAKAWASAAELRRAADAAVESIRETAIAQLAKSGKP